MGGLAYPFLVYFFMNDVPAFLWVILGGLMLGVRLNMMKPIEGIKYLPHILIVMISLTIVISIADPNLSPKLYPIFMSLGAAFIFGISLLFPPTLVERIATLYEGPLPEKGIIYTRKVTILWTCVLILNAIISAWTALYSDLNIWTLWNGLLSYLMMGTVFAIEFLVRRRVKEK